MDRTAGQRHPDVAAIVVNYRSTELTIESVRCVLSSAGAYSVEPIVVDVASPPAERALLHERLPGARIVELEDNRGFAASNNAGIAVAAARHLLLVNPDAFARDDAVARLVAHLDAEPSAGLAAPLLLNEDGSLQDNVFKRFPNPLTLFVDFCAPVARIVHGTRLHPHSVPRVRFDRVRPIAHAVGAALLVRSEAAHDAGPLDEGYFLYLEETDWQRRIAAAGWRSDMVPAARFVHLGGASSSGYPLASPHYLASVRRYFPRPALAVAAMWAGGAISFVFLRLLRLAGVRSDRVRELDTAFSSLMDLLIRDRRERRRRSRAQTV